MKNLKYVLLFCISLLGYVAYGSSCVLSTAGEAPKDAPVDLVSECGSSVDTFYVYSELIIDGSVDWRSYGAITLILQGNGTTGSAMLRFPNGPNILYLAENSVLILANGGILEGEPACSNADRLFIGSRSYARCSGGGNAEYLFSDLNSSGGSVRTAVEVSLDELCLGESFSMEATVEGGFDDNRRTELWVTPPSGTEEIIYGTEVTACDPESPAPGVAPFNITFTYNDVVDLGNYKYNTPGDYTFKAS